MFLLPNQQLERCDRVRQQRVKPHIHTTLAACTLRSFHNPGEPVPSSECLAKVRNGQVPFEPFRVPGVWGTTWGTTWFEVNGHIDMAAVKGRKVELMVDLGSLVRAPAEARRSARQTPAPALRPHAARASTAGGRVPKRLRRRRSASS